MHRSSTWAVVIMSFLSTGALGAAPTPEARVQAFIADFARLHAASGKIRDDGDFDKWSAAISRLDAAHFINGANSGLDGVMAGNPEHVPGSEKIIRNVRQDQDVLIETHFPDGSITRYYEYQLREVRGDWRIVKLRSYLDSAEQPYMTPAERARFEKPKTLPLRALPKNEAALDGSTLFTGGRIAQVRGESSPVEVRRVGTLKVTTGILVAGDLGYDSSLLAPLGQRIAPGQYPVEVSIAFKRVAALRLKMSDRPVAKWHPADMGDGGHVVGVDAANVFISDISALLPITSRHKEKEFEKFATTGDLTSALMLSLAEPDDVVVATSGYGDGAYPVYWGVDAAGKPAVLLVDMLVLTELGDEDDE
jgi:hypothetical protein